MANASWAAVLALWLIVFIARASACKQGWLTFGSKCFKIFEQQVTFVTADFKCSSEGGHLASISSEEVLEFVSVHLATKKVDRIWVGLLTNPRNELRWEDGVSAEDHPWVDERQVDSRRLQRIGLTHCFAFNGAKVMLYPCWLSFGFICSVEKSSVPVASLRCANQNTVSFTGEVTGRCIFTSVQETTKNASEEECKKSNGVFLDLDELMQDSLGTFYEQRVLANDGKRYWTGMQWNGTNVVWRNKQLPHVFPFYNGSGNCIAVEFNFTDEVEIQLHQTECNATAYVFCAFVPESVVTSTTLPRPSEQQQLMCPSGYNWKADPVTGYCYWETSYETSRLSWMDARKYCQSFGGDLASFHDISEERIGLSFQYGSLSHPYWIGLKLDEETETYKWSDGSPLDYENWAPGHPDHMDKRLKCVAMDASAKHWFSSLCGILSWFVCKAPKQQNPLPPLVPTPEPLVPCDENESENQLFLYKGFCYNVVDLQYSWHRAKQYCENEGSTLVSIHSDDEIGYLLKLIYNDKTLDGNRVWIGLNSLAPDGSFSWTDYSPLDFTYWNEDEPNNYLNQEKCCNMYTGNGLWNDENCNARMGFICKRHSDTSMTSMVPSTVDPTIGNCQKGWFTYHDRCYYLGGERFKDRKNWSEANDVCQSYGGYLVSIRNQREQAFLSYLMLRLKSDVWIGLHDTIQSGRYYWLDNSELDFTNWAPGEPSFFGIKEDCVKLVYEDLYIGVWKDVECNNKLPFICQTRKDPTLPPPEYSRGVSCLHPEGWLKLDNFCFEMFPGNPMKWQKAEDTCTRHGGHLVSITDSPIMAVVSFLAAEANKTFWIGLRYKESDRKTYWLNGWPSTVSKWDLHEPGAMTDDTCFASTANGYWKRFPCTEPLSFICQITTGKPPQQKRYAGDCPNTSKLWKPGFGSFCYLLNEKHRLDWYSASFQCYKYASELVSLHSMDDLYSLKETLPPGIRSFFIGLKRSGSVGFRWSDITPVDFVNWEDGQPDNSLDNCVEMNAETLKWRMAPCFVKNFFVCSKTKVQEVDDLPGKALLVDTSASNISPGTLAGIIVCLVLAIGIVVAAVWYYTPLGKSRFRNPFQHQSMSFENALYNVDTASMEFHDERQENEQL